MTIMAPRSTTSVVTQTVSDDSKFQLDSAQTLRASSALIRKIQSDKAEPKASLDKSNLLADADEEEVEDEIPLWLILTTKKHITDKKRLKPGKIVLPHPSLNPEDGTLRICLITADPQRKYKDLIEQPGFPLDLAKRIRIIGIEKIKSRYGKSFEARRQLFSEYDVFLADDRVITYLPQLLGKTFYKSGSKRPIPISLQGKRQDHDEQGNKRRKLAEGGTKAIKTEVKPQDVAKEIQRTLSCALVHLAPSTTTAIKVGTASMSAEHVQQNIEAVVESMVERYVPQKWRNLKAVHIKGPNTVALPVWLTQELWEDEQDVLDEAPPVKEPKKRKRSALEDGAEGANGRTKRLAAADADQKDTEARPTTDLLPAKKSEAVSAEDAQVKAAEKAEKATRKEALRKQKEDAKAKANSVTLPKKVAAGEDDKKTKKRKSKV